MVYVRHRNGFNPSAGRDAKRLEDNGVPYTKRIRGTGTTYLKDGRHPISEVEEDTERFFVPGFRFQDAGLQYTDAGSHLLEDGSYSYVSDSRGEFLHNGANGPRYISTSSIYDTQTTRLDIWYRPGYLADPNYVAETLTSGGSVLWFDHNTAVNWTSFGHYNCGVISIKQAVAIHFGEGLQSSEAFDRFVSNPAVITDAVAAGDAVVIEHDVWAFQERIRRTSPTDPSSYIISGTYSNDFPLFTIPQIVYGGDGYVFCFTSKLDNGNTRSRTREELWGGVYSIPSPVADDQISRSVTCTSPQVTRIATSDMGSTVTPLPLLTSVPGVPGSDGSGPYTPVSAVCFGAGKVAALYALLDADPSNEPLTAFACGAALLIKTVDNGNSWTTHDITTGIFTTDFVDTGSSLNRAGSKIVNSRSVGGDGYIFDPIVGFTTMTCHLAFDASRQAIITVANWSQEPGEVGAYRTSIHVSNDAGSSFNRTIIPFLDITGGVAFDPTITGSGDPGFTPAEQRFYHPVWAEQTGALSAVVLMQNAAVNFPQLSDQKRVYFLTTYDGFASYQQVAPVGLPANMHRWLSRISVVEPVSEANPFGTVIITTYDYYGTKDLAIYQSTDGCATWEQVDVIYENFEIGGTNNSFYDAFMARSWDWYPMLSTRQNRLTWYTNGALFSTPLYGPVQPTYTTEPFYQNPAEEWQQE